MIRQLDHINLSVRNFAESAEWYRRIFGFTVVEHGTIDGHPWGIIKAGDAMLCLYERPDRTQLDRYQLAERKIHGTNHFALRISDRQRWEETVEREDLALGYGGVVNWPHSAAWYIKDPTGYEIEVAYWTEGSPTFGTKSA